MPKSKRRCRAGEVEPREKVPISFKLRQVRTILIYRVLRNSRINRAKQNKRGQSKVNLEILDWLESL